jgi:hypothetical protein
MMNFYFMLRGDMFNREPRKDAVCEIAILDKEINKLVRGSLEHCKQKYDAEKAFKDQCLKCYGWAQGSNRGD